MGFLLLQNKGTERQYQSFFFKNSKPKRDRESMPWYLALISMVLTKPFMGKVGIEEADGYVART